MNIKNSQWLCQKLDIKCDGGGEEKIRRRRDLPVDDFDAVEIQRSESTNVDGAWVYCIIMLIV